MVSLKALVNPTGGVSVDQFVMSVNSLDKGCLIVPLRVITLITPPRVVGRNKVLM